ncbi:hypothetical protein Tco_0959850 [Tanacetum coccineum]
MFDIAFKRVNTFEDFRTELVKGKEKRAGTELVQKITKKQKVEDDKETTELKQLMKIIPDEDEVAIDAIPLAVKSPSIVDWEIYKEERKSYYQIMRADGKSQMYMFFSQMLKSFDREDLEDLYKLVKAKYESTRQVEDLDLLLWGDLKTMFEPHVEDKLVKNTSASKKDGQEFMKIQDAEIKVHNREHSEKIKMSRELRKKRIEQYRWATSSRLKPETITNIKIHPNTKLLAIKVYKGTDKRNFDVHKPFKFGDFDVFGDEAFQIMSDIHKVDVDTLLTYLMMALNVSTPANQRFCLALRSLIESHPAKEKLNSKRVKLEVFGYSLNWVHQSPCGIFISQSKYTLEILKKHGMDGCDSISTPMATARLDADLQGTPTDQTKYRSMIEGLMYLIARRPDIAFPPLFVYVIKHDLWSNTSKRLSGSFDT